jgi:hypothetical protein
MTRTNKTLLLIDDDLCHAMAFEQAVISTSDTHLKFEWARTLSTGVDRLGHHGVWAVFLNLFVPDSQGGSAL